MQRWCWSRHKRLREWDGGVEEGEGPQSLPSLQPVFFVGNKRFPVIDLGLRTALGFVHLEVIVEPEWGEATTQTPPHNNTMQSQLHSPNRLPP
jgi:hypothetical protein